MGLRRSHVEQGCPALRQGPDPTGGTCRSARGTGRGTPVPDAGSPVAKSPADRAIESGACRVPRRRTPGSRWWSEELLDALVEQRLVFPGVLRVHGGVPDDPDSALGIRHVVRRQEDAGLHEVLPVRHPHHFVAALLSLTASFSGCSFARMADLSSVFLLYRSGGRPGKVRRGSSRCTITRRRPHRPVGRSQRPRCPWVRRSSTALAIASSPLALGCAGAAGEAGCNGSIHRSAGGLHMSWPMVGP